MFNEEEYEAYTNWRDGFIDSKMEIHGKILDTGISDEDVSMALAGFLDQKGLLGEFLNFMEAESKWSSNLSLADQKRHDNDEIFFVWNNGNYHTGNY